MKIEVNILSFPKIWLIFGNGHHFSGTRIEQKHKHDIITIEFVISTS